jgi:hypothetical protein
MKKYVLSAEQLTKILDATIDRFMSYQFKKGFEEPRARQEAIMDVLEILNHRCTGATRPQE